MSVSVTDAASRAFSRTQKILFQPFDLNKWLAMGFCAFLATLGQGGAGGNYGNLFRDDRQGFDRVAEQAVEWIQAHMTLIVLLGTGILLLVLAVTILLQWLSSRGQFMFLDNVAHDRGAVSEPWGRYSELGNRLFYLRLGVGLAGFAFVVALLAFGAISAWPLLKAKEFGMRLVMSILIPGCLLLLVAFALGLFDRLLADFAVPIMYKRHIGPWAALKVFFGEALQGRYGELLLLYLLMLVLGVAAVIPMVLITCLTCCIAGLPYISSVVFLPVHVFFRCYTLSFLEQLGPEWSVWDAAPTPAAAPPAPPLPPWTPPPPAPPTEPQTGVPPQEVPPGPIEPK